MNSHQHRSLASIPEAELVGRLLRSPSTRGRLFAVRGVPQKHLFRNAVPLTGLLGDPRGDVDILLANADDFSDAVVFQVKRVKITLDTLRAGAPNRLGDLARGVQQANLMADIGFAQVYLWVIIAVDARSANNGRITYDGAPIDMIDTICSAIPLDALAPMIGVEVIQLTQPMDHEPLTVGSAGGHLIRLATPIQQPPHVNDWVEKALQRWDTLRFDA